MLVQKLQFGPELFLVKFIHMQVYPVIRPTVSILQFVYYQLKSAFIFINIQII